MRPVSVQASCSGDRRRRDGGQCCETRIIRFCMGKAAKGGCTSAALALDADSTRLQSLARHRHAARAMQARCGGRRARLHLRRADRLLLEGFDKKLSCRHVDFSETKGGVDSRPKKKDAGAQQANQRRAEAEDELMVELTRCDCAGGHGSCVGSLAAAG